MASASAGLRTRVRCHEPLRRALDVLPLVPVAVRAQVADAQPAQDRHFGIGGDGIILLKKSDKAESQGQFLHQGIASRSFERRFQLADYVKVIGADMENGLLHINLKREIPEAMKPRTIPIGKSASGPKTIEGKRAA